MNVKRCEGNGQGSCKRCNDKGIWNSSWMCFLYEVEGKDGVYCHKCVSYMKMEESYRNTLKLMMEGKDEHN